MDRALAGDAGSRVGAAPVRLVAAGKASGQMAAAFLARRPGPLVSAFAVGVEPPADLPAPVAWLRGGHPVPTDASEAAGRRALAEAASVAPPELLVVLLSGGASALMALPADGVTLADKQATTRLLLGAGADIHALNAVRKHLSLLKGGRLAAAARGRAVCLAISDVVGDDLSVIGSGPTVPDPSTFADALAVLDRFGGRARYPAPVVAVLERGARGGWAETPKPGDPVLRDAGTWVIGGARQALDGARDEAGRRGYHVHVHEIPVVGEARTAAREYARDLQRLLPGLPRPVCVLSAGETTVHVVGHGKGGRNQEFGLALAAELGPWGPRVAAVSLGTDGIDGPTDAAGVIVDATTMERARRAGLDPQRVLRDNDAYRFFEALGDLVITGPSGTNVGDVQAVLID